MKLELEKAKWKFKSQIVAKVIVSESEIQKLKPEFNENYANENPTEFNDILFQLGMDVSLPVTIQRGLKHRNRLNEVVTCTRWIGDERLDNAWLKSGNASQEAKDKSCDNKILDDMYRMKSLTNDTQAVLEERDRYSVIDETVWE